MGFNQPFYVDLLVCVCIYVYYIYVYIVGECISDNI